MNKFFTLLLFAFFTIVSGITFSQIELPEEKVKATISLNQNDCSLEVLVDVDIVEGWHINSHVLPEGSFSIPTNITVEKSNNYKFRDGIIEPKPILEFDEMADEMMSYHHHKFTLKKKITSKARKDYVLKGVFSFQTCNEVKCLPEYEQPFELKVKACGPVMELRDDVEPAAEINGPNEVAEAHSAEAEKTNEAESAAETETKDLGVEASVSEQSNESKEISDDSKSSEESSLWGVFLLAFFSGFLALIMPCVFPMIPMTVSFFTRPDQSRANGIKNALFYGASIVLIHLLLGGIVVATGAGELLNQLSTNVYFNIFFFLMLFTFGLSFLGAFEIQLPAKWVNSADKKADKGGIVGIFFMALVLSLASFSCTGPILGALLGGLSAYGGSSALMVGMFAFGLALALPFMLFAIFPAWLTSMPSSGGWLNVVKVFLGFLEIAFAFKFLSTADTTMQWHLLEREIFISIWIAVFGTLTLYLFGKIRLPHDSPIEKLSVGRSMMATFVLAFTIYLIPGLWGAPLQLVNAFLPPDFYAESPGGFSGGNGSHNDSAIEMNHIDGMHEGPLGIMAFKDYEKAKVYAQKIKKPLFIDFTGWGCVNCRKMEQTVWRKPGIIERLKNDVVIVSLYVDERTELPLNEQTTVNLNGREIDVVTIGNKWTLKQMRDYKNNSQPYYIMQSPDGVDLNNGAADYQNHSNPDKFKEWLEAGLNENKKLVSNE